MTTAPKITITVPLCKQQVIELYSNKHISLKIAVFHLLAFALNPKSPLKYCQFSSKNFADILNASQTSVNQAFTDLRRDGYFIRDARIGSHDKNWKIGYNLSFELTGYIPTSVEDKPKEQLDERVLNQKPILLDDIARLEIAKQQALKTLSDEVTKPKKRATVRIATSGMEFVTDPEVRRRIREEFSQVNGYLKDIINNMATDEGNWSHDFNLQRSIEFMSHSIFTAVELVADKKYVWKSGRVGEDGEVTEASTVRMDTAHCRNIQEAIETSFCYTFSESTKMRTSEASKVIPRIIRYICSCYGNTDVTIDDAVFEIVSIIQSGIHKTKVAA